MSNVQKTGIANSSLANRVNQNQNQNQGQTQKASELFDKYKTIFGSTLAAKVLTNACNSMSTEVDNIIQDQNDYFGEIEVELGDIIGLQEDMDNQVAQLEKEINELLAKKEDGTITEEEEKELESKTGEISTLTSSANSQIESKNSALKGLVEKSNSCTSYLKSAEDYASTAVEKGEPLANTQNKRKSFWRKIFGGWDKSGIREVGENLVEAGNNLGDKVGSASQIMNEIKAKAKKSV